MVSILFVYSDQHESLLNSGFKVDGNLGPLTRLFIALELDIDFNAIPFVEGGECMYADPALPEPLHWDATSTVPDVFLETVEEEPIKS